MQVATAIPLWVRHQDLNVWGEVRVKPLTGRITLRRNSLKHLGTTQDFCRVDCIYAATLWSPAVIRTFAAICVRR